MSSTEVKSSPESGASAPPTGRQEQRGRSIWRTLSITRLSAVYLWIGFIVLFAIIAPDTFLTETTFRLVFRSGVITCLLALAFLIPLAAGQFDLSIGAMMALALALMVWMSLHTGLPPLVCAALILLLTACVGWLSAWLIVRWHVNSFIATLGISQLLLSAVLFISSNRQMSGDFPISWANVGTGNILGIPALVYILLLVALVLWYVMEQTRTGRYLFATGGNPDAARLAGVPTARIVYGAFIASAVICGLAGVIYTTTTPVFSTMTGPGYLFPAVAAVFLGASQLSQRPNVWGTLIAYFALAFGVQGLMLSASGAAVWSQPMFQGLSLIIAVALASRPAARKLRSAHSDDEVGAPA